MLDMAMPSQERSVLHIEPLTTSPNRIKFTCCSTKQLTQTSQ